MRWRSAHADSYLSEKSRPRHCPRILVKVPANKISAQIQTAARVAGRRIAAAIRSPISAQV